jgi:hypothetical protein
MIKNIFAFLQALLDFIKQFGIPNGNWTQKK